MYLNLIFVDFEGEIPLQFLDTNLQILAIVQCCVMDCSSFLVERRAKGVKNSHQKHYGLVRMCTLFNDLTRNSIANNFVIDVYCRCLQILYQIAFFYKI